MKKRYILPLISLGLSAYIPANAWDGVLLINQSDNNLTVFVDHVENLNGVTLDVFDGTQKKSFNLSESGGKFQAELDSFLSAGWVRVNKNGVAMASVRLDNFLNAPVAYIDKRDQVMELARTGKSTPTSEATPTEFAEVKPESSSNQTKEVVEVVQQEAEVVKQEVQAVEKEIVVQNTEVQSTENTIPQSEVAVVKDEVPQEENLVASTTYAKASTETEATTVDTAEEVTKKEEVVAEVKYDRAFAAVEKKSYSKTDFKYTINSLIAENHTEFDSEEKRDWIDYLTYDFTMVKKHDGWVELEDRKHKHESYAYNGIDAFRYEEDKFVLNISSDKDTKAFFEQNKVRLIPVSRKWVGIFFGSEFKGKVKWKKEFTFKANGVEELVVSGDKKDLKFKPNHQIAKK